MSASELSRRAQKILHAVVTEYLQVGDAVGSRTVTRRHDLGLSPATVGKLIAVLVTTDGRIENRSIVDDVDPRRLERIHNYLNTQLSGLTIDEVRELVIRELGEDKSRYDEAIAAALRLGHAVFVEGGERQANIVVSGQANLLDDALEQDRARELLRTLEDKE